MGSKSQKSGSARTPPKGRATTARNERTGRRRLLTPTLEWVLAIIALALVFAAIFYFLGDVRSNTGGTTGAPLTAIAATVGPMIVG